MDSEPNMKGLASFCSVSHSKTKTFIPQIEVNEDPCPCLPGTHMLFTFTNAEGAGDHTG